MTEAKHTPGPWALQGNSTVIAPNMPRIKYGKHEEYERAYIVCQPDLYTDPEWGGEEKRANARLIAAAPKMYALLAIRAESGDNDAVKLLQEIDDV